MDPKIAQQLEFLAEIDKMKQVLRQTLLMDGSRRENDAEHSWHLATMALVLREYAAPEVDLFRVLQMALVHDLIEIYAGDTFAFDDAANQDKEAREQAAADRLFGMLPTPQGAELRALWEEFDAMETPDAGFAAACDRLQPFFHNTRTQGHTWQLGPVTRAQVYRRMDPVRWAMPALWPFVEEQVALALSQGQLKAD